MKHKTYWVQSFWFSACEGSRVTTGEYSFCFRLSPCDCTASKEEPGGGTGNVQYLNPLIVSGNEGQVLGPAGIVSRNASRWVCTE